ncbi:MAG: Polyprenyl synthetase [Clostridia bacterium]|nr:Polyprenyl synthetase [Clostridia bacterium]
MKLHEYLDTKRKIVDTHLEDLVSGETNVPVIYEAMKYSLLAGGKRLRPILADLPAMDNDDYRRGKLTNHKVYGEGIAILAGDALLNRAFEIVHEALIRNPKLEYIKAAAYLSKASGTDGMIGGQCIDLYYENKQIDIDILNRMHEKKTGAMIKAPLVIGALIAGAKDDDIERIDKFGELIGLAFQISDDILDVEGSTEKLGKKTGSDISNNKSTFVSYYGLEESKRIARNMIEEAQKLISIYGNKGLLLKELSNYIIERDV